MNVPVNRIGVEFHGGIKPESDSLFSVAHSSSENICLDDVWLPQDIAKELEVYFVVIGLARQELPLPKQPKINQVTIKARVFEIRISYVEGDDGAGRVARHQLDLHVELAKQEHVVRGKASSWR